MNALAGDEGTQGSGSSDSTASAAEPASAGGLPATTAAVSPPSTSPSPFAGDAWLDANAVWRRQSATTTSCKGSRATSEDNGDRKRDGDKHASSFLPCRYYLEGVVTGDVAESRVGWFRRSGGAWTSLPAGEGEGGGPWEAFSAKECRRLEKAFRAQPVSSTSPTQASTSTSAEHPTAAPKAFAAEKPQPAERNGDGVGGDIGGGNETGSTGGNGAATAAAGVEAGADTGGGGGGGSASVAYQPTGGVVLEFHNYEVKPDDVLVEQGRHAVSVREMLMRPVFWPFSGQGDEVCRAVWMRDTGARPYPRPRKRRGTSGAAAAATTAAAAATTTGGVGKDAQENNEDGETDLDEDDEEGPVGLEPYPLRAAAILEDAYQFLAWYLECRERGGSSPGARSSGEGGDNGSRGKGGGGGSLSPTVLLTVQVADELVQFRSLTDIVSVKRNLGSAFSLFGRRRVFRGVPVDEEGGSEEEEEGERKKREADGTETGLNDDCDATLYPVPPTSSGTPYASGLSLGATEDEAVAGSSTDSEQSPSSGPTQVGGYASEEGGGRGRSRAKRSPSSPCSLQQQCRGAEGADEVDSDLEERVEHLVLVVHGIGDALMSVDLGMVQLRSLVECCDTMRAHHEEVVLNSKDLRGLRKKGLRKKGGVGGGGGGGRDGDGHGGATAEETQEKEDEARDGLGELPAGLGRVEYLPVEWHTRFKGRLYREGGGSGGAAEGGSKGNPDTSPPSGATRRPGSEGGPGSGEGRERGGRAQSWATGAGAGGGGGGSAGLSIWDITLPRAPTLRAFTNDTLLDILYFMSPEYHQVLAR
ncbi:unnamed protein product, partial [Ectocarpus fasciculatus]